MIVVNFITRDLFFDSIGACIRRVDTTSSYEVRVVKLEFALCARISITYGLILIELKGGVLSWEWTVVCVDNRLCYLRENIDIGVKNAELHGLIYAVEIIAGSALYFGKYKLHTGMRGVTANDTVGTPDLPCGYTNGMYKLFV